MARVHAAIGEGVTAGGKSEAAVYEETEDAALIAGTVFISGEPAYVLIDTGASHSFVSANYVKSRGWSTSPRGRAMEVRTPLGRFVEVNQICRDQKIQVARRDLRANLTVLDMRDFDAILGMDWLVAHAAVVD